MPQESDTGEAGGLYPFVSQSQEDRKVIRTGLHQWLKVPLGCLCAAKRCKTKGFLVGYTLPGLPAREDQQVLPGKFFLDDLTVVHLGVVPEAGAGQVPTRTFPSTAEGPGRPEAACDWAKRGAGQARPSL